MPYQPEHVTAITAAVVFVAGFAGHGVGDQWIQTCDQAVKKSLDGDASTATAMWHCAKHVATYTATTLVFLLAAVWWLGLPVRPGWVAAGLTINAATHWVIDLRTPLIWLAKNIRNGRDGYIEHCQAFRPAGAGAFEKTGPGTALFHLDYTLHIAIWFFCSLLAAGPA